MPKQENRLLEGFNRWNGNICAYLCICCFMEIIKSMGWKKCSRSNFFVWLCVFHGGFLSMGFCGKFWEKFRRFLKSVVVKRLVNLKQLLTWIFKEFECIFWLQSVSIFVVCQKFEDDSMKFQLLIKLSNLTNFINFSFKVSPWESKTSQAKSSSFHRLFFHSPLLTDGATIPTSEISLQNNFTISLPSSKIPSESRLADKSVCKRCEIECVWL